MRLFVSNVNFIIIYALCNGFLAPFDQSIQGNDRERERNKKLKK